MGNTAFLMPGQGSQYVGMLGKLDAYPKAQQIISKVNGVLGFDLVKLMKEGPIEELTQTENTQPALVACSAAWLEVAKEKGLSCQFALGHSLGEYSALYAAEAIDIETALRLVRRRGELMRDATSKIPGTMRHHRTPCREGKGNLPGGFKNWRVRDGQFQFIRSNRCIWRSGSRKKGHGAGKRSQGQAGKIAPGIRTIPFVHDGPCGRNVCKRP